MKVKFVLNVPQTLALQNPSGEYVEAYEEVCYPTVDGRELVLPTRDAERLNLLDLRPGESFALCRQWNHEKGTIPQFTFWLSPASEKARAAAEIAQDEPQQPANMPIPAPASQQAPQEPRKRLKRKKGMGEVVTLRPDAPAQPQIWSGNGTYGPAPRPAIATAQRPARIPYNVAFREVVRFVTAGLKESGEQWNDQARQDLVSTALISASQQGWLQLWERP